MLNSSFLDRCEILGRYIIENNATVRETGKAFGISKSTVHKDITEKLSKINHTLFLEVEKILQKNKMERHIRGGEATKQKYLNHKE
ncbi:MAG: stage III sporulation protein D [Ruminococcaceae bacterium]|nr:stage III sporulation protein D [Oscillospiraceae bacterium]